MAICAGTLFTERGTIVTVFIICYALTSFVAGYVRYIRGLRCPYDALSSISLLVYIKHVAI